MVRKIKKAAVIGSGIMGGGIAALLAGAGVDVLLLDIVPFDLKDEEKNDPKARNRIVTAGLEAATKAKPPLFFSKADVSRITTGNLEDDFGKLAECDWIVEVVVENLKIKQDLFARIDAVRSPNTIVSSNTSGIPLKAMSENCSKAFKENFLGTRFFNPVRYMHLLEIIRASSRRRGARFAPISAIGCWARAVWAKDHPELHRHGSACTASARPCSSCSRRG